MSAPQDRLPGGLPSANTDDEARRHLLRDRAITRRVLWIGVGLGVVGTCVVNAAYATGLSPAISLAGGIVAFAGWATMLLAWWNLFSIRTAMRRFGL